MAKNPFDKFSHFPHTQDIQDMPSAPNHSPFQRDARSRRNVPPENIFSTGCNKTPPFRILLTKGSAEEACPKPPQWKSHENTPFIRTAFAARILRNRRIVQQRRVPIRRRIRHAVRPLHFQRDRHRCRGPLAAGRHPGNLPQRRGTGADRYGLYRPGRRIPYGVRTHLPERREGRTPGRRTGEGERHSVRGSPSHHHHNGGGLHRSGGRQFMEPRHCHEERGFRSGAQKMKTTYR